MFMTLKELQENLDPPPTLKKKGNSFVLGLPVLWPLPSTASQMKRVSGAFSFSKKHVRHGILELEEP